MAAYFKRALKDIKENRFISFLTIVTISLLVLMVSTFVLFVNNAERMMQSWKAGIRVMVYLKPGLPEPVRDELRKKIVELPDVKEIRFVSKEQALDILRKQMDRQAAILDDLDENPLPDAFEILIGSDSDPDLVRYDRVEILADKINRFSGVEQVEYGRQWLERFSSFFDLFRLIGFAIGGVFVFAATFIIANTIRLIVYTRQDELQIMRLVGASNRFIKTPFYLQGIVQGFLGALIGLGILYGGYSYWISSTPVWFVTMDIRFLSIKVCMIIVVSSMLLGWLGCFVSLRQFLKD